MRATLNNLITLRVNIKSAVCRRFLNKLPSSDYLKKYIHKTKKGFEIHCSIPWLCNYSPILHSLIKIIFVFRCKNKKIKINGYYLTTFYDAML